MLKKRKVKVIFITILSSLLSILLACFIYVSNYYEAQISKIEEYISNNDLEYEIIDGNIVYNVENPVAGFIFYPGGKVEYSSYIPLMEELALNNIMCVIIKMPFNLAVFGMNKASNIIDNYDVDNWYIGGHSLGGAIACSYLEKNYEKFNGVIWLGAYSTTDLSNKNLDVLSIYGEYDLVLNMKKYHECISNLPSDYVEYIIDGGCHAYFGMYGNQDGDGIPTISDITQINITANLILEFIK